MFDLLVLALAVARLSRLITSDSLLQRPREALLRRWPTDDTTFGDSEVTKASTNTFGQTVGTLTSGVEVIRAGDAWYPLNPYLWSELVTCVWCNSFWLAVAVSAVYFFYPGVTVFAAPFAISYIVGFLHDRS